MDSCVRGNWLFQGKLHKDNQLQKKLDSIILNWIRKPEYVK